MIQKVTLYVSKVIGFSEASGEGTGSNEETIAPFVDGFVDFREKVRMAAKAKSDPNVSLHECDDVQDEALAALGIRVEDSNESSIWKMDGPRKLHLDDV